MKTKEQVKTKKIKNSDPRNFWTVRGVSFEVRALAKKAAESENMLIGNYLSKIIQEDAIETIKKHKLKEKTSDTKNELDRPFDTVEYWKVITHMQESQNKFAQDMSNKIEMIIEVQNKLSQQKEEEQNKKEKKRKSFFSGLFLKI